MNESKIVATKRLQSEGLWNEASLYREEMREHLRGEGMTRKEANKGAWEEMLETYPPADGSRFYNVMSRYGIKPFFCKTREMSLL